MTTTPETAPSTAGEVQPRDVIGQYGSYLSPPSSVSLHNGAMPNFLTDNLDELSDDEYNSSGDLFFPPVPRSAAQVLSFFGKTPVTEEHATKFVTFYQANMTENSTPLEIASVKTVLRCIMADVYAEGLTESEAALVRGQAVRLNPSQPVSTLGEVAHSHLTQGDSLIDFAISQGNMPAPPATPLLPIHSDSQRLERLEAMLAGVQSTVSAVSEDARRAAFLSGAASRTADELKLLQAETAARTEEMIADTADLAARTLDGVSVVTQNQVLDAETEYRKSKAAARWF